MHKRHLEIVKLLIKKKANVNAGALGEQTPLHDAAKNGEYISRICLSCCTKWARNFNLRAGKEFVKMIYFFAWTFDVFFGPVV